MKIRKKRFTPSMAFQPPIMLGSPIDLITSPVNTVKMIRDIALSICKDASIDQTGQARTNTIVDLEALEEFLKLDLSELKTEYYPPKAHMNYLELLKHSYAVYLDPDQQLNNGVHNKYTFLSEAVFDFTTYDPEIDRHFVTKALEVCQAINDRTTFEYIEASHENYVTFLAMCNHKFFEPKLEWGGSIRGAWWDEDRNTGFISIESCYLYEGDRQILEPINFTVDQWREFIKAMLDFMNEPETK